MKKLLESEFMQMLIAAVIVSYLRFCYATTHWHIEGQEAIEAVWAAKGPVVWMFWHERLHMAHVAWPQDRAQPLAVLASLSKSGEVSVKINSRFGHHSIRGSSAKKSDPAKQKGGAAAFRDLLRWMRKGGCAVMTPDGPRGPARIMTEGTLKLSQMSAAPIVILGQATRSFMRFKTWDGMRVPLPFTTGAMVWQVLSPVPALSLIHI